MTGDWSEALQKIKNNEIEVDSRLNQCVKQEHLSALQKNAIKADETSDQLGDIHKTIETFIAEQKARMATKVDDQLRDSLRIVDPKDDMTTIEKQKDKLFEGSCKWILDNQMFKDFTSDTYIAGTDPGSRDVDNKTVTQVPPQKDQKPYFQ
ncbi:hypothetical protein Sste5346_003645 [Sporothrix stenoceras]|uniref:Uncharacterized protein n=1 Tax=Sporothrix stenoceras TaxID=5173 RepID=A0ABR3ZD50_9PEZI